MKKKFLLVSMIAAAMLTASCSKEDNGDNSEQPVNVEQQIVQNTRPIVIKVDKKTSLSKVGTSDGYVLTFSEGDKLVLTDGATQYAELELQEGDAGKQTATFTGNISIEADGKDIYATIGSPLEGVQTSSTSLADVVENNCYLKSAAFQYSQESELNVELNDQNAYLVFSVSEGQKKVNIGGENDWYPTDGDIVNQTLYVAVSAGNVSGRFFGTKTLEASNIYTITRTDVVDLGQTVDERKIVWKTTNETSGTATLYNQGDAETSVYKDEKYYTWSNACAFGRLDNTDADKYISGSANPFRLPTQAEFKNLGKGTWTSKNEVNGREFSTTYGSVFFPAAGYGGGKEDRTGVYGYYWSGESRDGDNAWYLIFDSGFAAVSPYLVGSEYSVRLVRGL